MSILAIETATSVCGAALASGGRVVSELWVEERSVHAERLFGLIDGVLTEAARDPHDLRAVAVSIGPGSFTGLRIGLSAAKGFHLSLGIPLIEVPTLTALARRAIPLFEGRSGHILAALDARRDEVYCQTFDVQEGNIAEAGEVLAQSLREVCAGLPDGDIVLTGDGRQKVYGGVSTIPALQTRSVRVADDAVARCSAAEVARMGEVLFAQRRFADARSLEPRYVKEVFLRSSH